MYPLAALGGRLLETIRIEASLSDPSTRSGQVAVPADSNFGWGPAKASVGNQQTVATTVPVPA
jgi:hypothetical protein